MIDNGNYTYVAPYLKKYFDEVKYFNRWGCSFPKIGAMKIGDGIDGVEKVMSWENHISDSDIIFFTDIYFRDTANMLIDMGKKVWGSGNMETQERDRGLFLDTLEAAGLPIAKTTIVKGISELKDALKGRKEAFIKISEYRGIKETWKFIDMRFADALISELELLLGIYKETIPIFIQEPVGDLEYGIDPIVSKCNLAGNMPIGVEDKDCQYFMKFDKFVNLPTKLQEVHTKYLDQVKKTDAKDYCGHLSTEVRVDSNGVNYFGDVTPRNGSPSSASMYYGCDNFGDIIEGVLDGNPVDFSVKHKYVVEIILETKCMDKWNPIYFDDKYKDQIFLSAYAVQDGYTYKCPPNQTFDHSDWVGSVCGGGESIEEAVDNAKEAAANIDAFGLYYKEPIMKNIYNTIELMFDRASYVF